MAATVRAGPVRSQELQGLPCRWRAQSLWLFSIASPGALAKSWIGSGVTGIQTSTHMGWWHHIFHFYQLCHSPGPRSVKKVVFSTMLLLLPFSQGLRDKVWSSSPGIQESPSSLASLPSSRFYLPYESSPISLFNFHCFVVESPPVLKS